MPDAQPQLAMPPDYASNYSRGEEIANTLSSAIGLVAALAAAPFFLAKARHSDESLALLGAGTFLLATVIMYGASTLYHAIPPGATKHKVRLLDHSAIFVLIAGTYTPLAVGPLRHDGGLVLLALEWLLAVVGIFIKTCGGFSRRHLSNALYLLMGWAGLFWLNSFIEHVTMDGFLWVLAGGIAYTVGIVFYLAKKRAYAHFIWHLFVFAGTCCHAYAIWRYIL
ncbi:hemolysin III family protein [soil metagenome]